MVRREKYLAEIRGFYRDDLIKIITGVRRCGKSIVLEQIREELSESTDNFVFLYFDFLAEKDGRKTYIQVAWSVVENETWEREFSAFSGIPAYDRKIIITNDETD